MKVGDVVKVTDTSLESKNRNCLFPSLCFDGGRGVVAGYFFAKRAVGETPANIPDAPVPDHQLFCRDGVGQRYFLVEHGYAVRGSSPRASGRPFLAVSFSVAEAR